LSFTEQQKEWIRATVRNELRIILDKGLMYSVEAKPQPKPDMADLTWEPVQTDNPFEVNKQTENENWKALVTKIAEHKGKPIYVEGYVYWLMHDGVTLARRKK
jgi:hypothetical protein